MRYYQTSDETIETVLQVRGGLFFCAVTRSGTGTVTTLSVVVEVAAAVEDLEVAAVVDLAVAVEAGGWRETAWQCQR